MSPKQASTMSPQSILPFVEAVQATFRTMMNVQAEATDVVQGKSIVSGYDVSGIVGIVGESEGAVVLSFEEAVARRVVGCMLGTSEVPTLDQDVADGIGELANVIVGYAKRGLVETCVGSITASLPTVILGAQHRIFRLRDVECVVARFTSEIGCFLLQVHLRESDRGLTSAPEALADTERLT